MLRTAGPPTSASLLVNTRLRAGCELVMASVRSRGGASRFDMCGQTNHTRGAGLSSVENRDRALARRDHTSPSQNERASPRDLRKFFGKKLSAVHFRLTRYCLSSHGINSIFGHPLWHPFGDHRALARSMPVLSVSVETPNAHRTNWLSAESPVAVLRMSPNRTSSPCAAAGILVALIITASRALLSRTSFSQMARKASLLMTGVTVCVSTNNSRSRSSKNCRVSTLMIENSTG
jgi:hypothetical protein